MSSIFSNIYTFISSYMPLSGQSPMQSSVAALSSRDRNELVHDIATEVNHEEVESSLAELEVTIAECTSSLEEFNTKERFIGTRIDSYRKLMKQREELMSTLMQQSTTTPASNYNEEKNELLDDVESKESLSSATKTQLDTLQTKHAADEKSLQEVIELHKYMISEIESLRRRIADLESKKESIEKQREECQDFLMAAEEYNHINFRLEDLEGSNVTTN